MSADPALARRRDHPTRRARRRYPVVGDRMHDPPTIGADADPHNGQPIKPEQPRGTLLALDQAPMHLRTLEHARDLTS